MSGWSQRSQARTEPSGDNVGATAQSPSRTRVVGAPPPTATTASSFAGSVSAPTTAPATLSVRSTTSDPACTSRSQMIHLPATPSRWGVTTPAA